MNDYWFFLSYARVDFPSQVAKFYADLALEIGSLAALHGKSSKEIGFLDQNGIDLGRDWSETVRAALQTSRVLVCLYSHAYFKSLYCGKEFEVFLERHAPIMPVLWGPAENLPKPLP